MARSQGATLPNPRPLKAGHEDEARPPLDPRATRTKLWYLILSLPKNATATRQATSQEAVLLAHDNNHLLAITNHYDSSMLNPCFLTNILTTNPVTTPIRMCMALGQALEAPVPLDQIPQIQTGSLEHDQHPIWFKYHSTSSLKQAAELHASIPTTLASPHLPLVVSSRVRLQRNTDVHKTSCSFLKARSRRSCNTSRIQVMRMTTRRRTEIRRQARTMMRILMRADRVFRLMSKRDLLVAMRFRQGLERGRGLVGAVVVKLRVVLGDGSDYVRIDIAVAFIGMHCLRRYS
jgi:hypothetical protein